MAVLKKKIMNVPTQRVLSVFFFSQSVVRFLTRFSAFLFKLRRGIYMDGWETMGEGRTKNMISGAAKYHPIGRTQFAPFWMVGPVFGLFLPTSEAVANITHGGVRHSLILGQQPCSVAYIQPVTLRMIIPHCVGHTITSYGR